MICGLKEYQNLTTLLPSNLHKKAEQPISIMKSQKVSFQTENTKKNILCCYPITVLCI